MRPREANRLRLSSGGRAVRSGSVSLPGAAMKRSARPASSGGTDGPIAAKIPPPARVAAHPIATASPLLVQNHAAGPPGSASGSLAVDDGSCPRGLLSVLMTRCLHRARAEGSPPGPPFLEALGLHWEGCIWAGSDRNMRRSAERWCGTSGVVGECVQVDGCPVCARSGEHSATTPASAGGGSIFTSPAPRFLLSNWLTPCPASWRARSGRGRSAWCG